MKVKILEVLWHDKAPVHSVDMDATGRLATAGSDNNVRLWRLVFGGQGEGSTGSSQTHVADAIEVEFLATLNRHQAPVNVVRFSPNGQRLASAGDDGLVLLWKFINAEPKKATLGDEDEGGKETWGIDKTLRGGAAGSDIYDITWSSDGAFLAAASIDHTVRVFDVFKGICVGLLLFFFVVFFFGLNNNTCNRNVHTHDRRAHTLRPGSRLGPALPSFGFAEFGQDVPDLQNRMERKGALGAAPCQAVSCGCSRPIGTNSSNVLG